MNITPVRGLFLYTVIQNDRYQNDRYQNDRYQNNRYRNAFFEGNAFQRWCDAMGIPVKLNSKYWSDLRVWGTSEIRIFKEIDFLEFYK